MATFCLSVHAEYSCRHSGACCTAPWQIPIEVETLRRLRTHDTIAKILDRTHDSLDVGRQSDGSCVFFERNGDRLCSIHRVAGAELLPSACRHFPRVVLRDHRGAFVTLSGFCPTAAAMLLTPAPLRIVDAPPSLALDGRLEGLDATEVLPPLLRPGLLMDYDGFTAWEQAAIATLDRDDLTPDGALEAIAAATSDVQSWAPGQERLSDRVRTAFERIRSESGDSTAGEARPIRMFMAAHLFGSWAAYQHGGVSGVVEAVRSAVAVLRAELASGTSFVEAVGRTDLKLRHRKLRTRNEELRTGEPESW